MTEAEKLEKYSIKLDLHYSLGFRRTTSTTATHIDEEEIVYLAGRHITKYNHENHTHQYLIQQPKVSEVVCFCVSTNRKYIAVSEKMMDRALQVTVYSLAKLQPIRTLKFEYISKMSIVSMCFSHDNKYLATVTAMPLISTSAVPEVFVYLWQLDKSWLLCMLDLAMEVTQITISPWSFSSIACTGSSSKYGGCKLLKYADKQFIVSEPLVRAKGKDLAAQSHMYTCHAWVDEEVIVAGTEEGDLLVAYRGEYREMIHHVHGEGNAVCAIHTIARGFVCGGENGFFSVFERSFDELAGPKYAIYKKFQDPTRHRIIGITIAPSEQNAVLCYVNNSMSQFALDNIDILQDNDLSCFVLLGNGFHRDFITAIDTCLQKSFVVTASNDHTVRIWNYARKKVELVHTFDDEVISVAVHPTGLRIIVGFKFCLRMYNVLHEGLHMCCEFPIKQCYEVRFSPGGQYFAAVVISRILIFNSYDFVCLGPLPGNTSVVKSICWSKDDRRLVSAEVNGVIFLWDIDEMKANHQEDSRKNISYNCVCYDDSTMAIAALGSNRLAEQELPEGDVCIRNVITGQSSVSTRMGFVNPNLQRREHTSEMALSLLCQTLFVGTPTGQLLVFRWPVKENDQPTQRIDVHNGAILLVQLSSDDRYLFTIGDDNVMFMMEVSGFIDGRQIAFKEFNAAPFEEVTYVLQSDIDSTVTQLEVLQSKLLAIQNDTTDASQAIRDRHNRDLTITRRGLEGEIYTLREQLNKCLQEKEHAIESIRDNKRHLEGQHIKSAEDLEHMYAQRSHEANVAYNKLKIEREDMIVRQEAKIFKLGKEQAAEKAALVERVKQQETELEQDMEELRRSHAEATTRTDQMLDMAIEYYERNIDDANSKNSKDIEMKQDEHSRTAMKTQTYRLACEKLEHELKDLRASLAADEKEFRDKEEKIDKRKKESETYKKEMSVRNETITASEKKIGQLKKQTAELEKLRYVLTFKLTELKKEVHPKDEQIKVLNTRVEEMSREFDKVCSDRVTLDQARMAKADKLRVIQADIESQKVILQEKERIIVAMLRELTELTRSPDADLQDLVYKLKDIVMKFNLKYSCEDAMAHKDRTGEFERQRDHMEAQLSSISKQNQRKEEYLLQDNQRKTTENALLVREINELRHELKYLGGKMALSEVQLKEAKVAVSRATTTNSPIASKTSASSSSVKTVSVSKKVKELRSAPLVDSAKIAEIIAQVEANNVEMERQQSEIQTLRSYVQILLSHIEASNPTSKDAVAPSPV